MSDYFNDENTREKLEALRNEIVLGSLYATDYENSFGFDPHAVQDFFDGYIEFLEEVEQEEKRLLDGYDFSDLVREYDDIGNLENWYDITLGSDEPSIVF